MTFALTCALTICGGLSIFFLLGMTPLSNELQLPKDKTA